VLFTMTEAERQGLDRMFRFGRIGMLWLPLCGFAFAAVAALEYHMWPMLGIAIALFLLAGVFNVVYMFSRCPRCHRLFHSLSRSRVHLIWLTRQCRHCGLALSGEHAQARGTPIT